MKYEYLPVCLEITADWLFSKNSDGDKRAWIDKKYFYITPKGYGRSEYSDREYHTGHLSPYKYRFLGYCLNKYAFKICDYKGVGGWSGSFKLNLPPYKNKLID